MRPLAEEWESLLPMLEQLKNNTQRQLEEAQKTARDACELYSSHASVVKGVTRTLQRGSKRAAAQADLDTANQHAKAPRIASDAAPSQSPQPPQPSQPSQPPSQPPSQQQANGRGQHYHHQHYHHQSHQPHQSQFRRHSPGRDGGHMGKGGWGPAHDKGGGRGGNYRRN